MKKVLSYLMLVTILSLTLFSSCKKDVDDRDAFIGTWNVMENWSNPYGGSGTDNYTINISKSSSTSNGIIITSLGGVYYNFTINATVSGSSVTIPNQTINSGGDLYNVSGSGTISGSTMNFTYYVLDGWTGICTATKL